MQAIFMAGKEEKLTCSFGLKIAIFQFLVLRNALFFFIKDFSYPRVNSTVKIILIQSCLENSPQIIIMEEQLSCLEFHTSTHKVGF